MRVGLIEIEPKVVNTAYMQISSFHKLRGDTVEWWTPLEHLNNRFDVVYCSSIFDYTDKSQIPGDVICGGTGFDVTSRLSTSMEECDYDYSIYPKCRKSFLWFSRGCIRKCPWCVVPEKEGKIRAVEPKNLNPNAEDIVVMDNNFFASRNWYYALQYLRGTGLPVDITQGIDARIMTKRMCRELLKLRRPEHKRIRIAWDDPKEDMVPYIEKMIQVIPRWALMCYVLIGYWEYTDCSAEELDLYRVEKLRSLGVDPFVMPYDKNDLYQRAFARWVNHKAIFKKIPWNNYKRRVYQSETAGHGWKK